MQRHDNNVVDSDEEIKLLPKLEIHSKLLRK